ncbi:MAG: aspartyl-tRNA(Asn)/glutamyl-tRNA(Gln) amidotransferase subunit A [Paracoccaceae bacterium]|jgi:aspartyl-tRNA(Asn)/glutamyl-tRNA(Gln) amidotransferase subunit A
MTRLAPQRVAAIVTADAALHFLEDISVSLPVDLVAQAPADGPLAGLVVGVKSNFAVAGQAWTAGLAGRVSQIATVDAAIVGRLRAGGAHILSRLNMDEAALGAATDNPNFGRTDNPAALGYSPGGSSGGSAAAVAAGCVDAALGSDTLGSVRIPASYCGVWGLKPGRDVLSQAGLFPLAPMLDEAGILARDPEVLRRLFRQMAGRGASAPRRCEVRVPTSVGLVPCSPEVQRVFGLVCQGITVAGTSAKPADVTVETPFWDPATLRKAAFVITAFEAAQALAGLPDTSPGLQALLDYGAGVSMQKRGAAQQVLARARRDFEAVFSGDRVLMTPTTPDPAFLHGTDAPRTQADFTALANVLGYPALAVPVPSAGRPVSFQLIGGLGSEEALIATGAALLAQVSLWGRSGGT